MPEDGMSVASPKGEASLRRRVALANEDALCWGNRLHTSACKKNGSRVYLYYNILARKPDLKAFSNADPIAFAEANAREEKLCQMTRTINLNILPNLLK